jgi:PAS domain S-box-containing protein
MISAEFHVWLIDDSPDDVASIRHSLCQAVETRFEVSCFNCLADVIAHLDSTAKLPDAALLDLNLPDSAGLATLSALHQRAPELPIVVCSGLENPKLAIEAVKAGAQDWLGKGETTSALLERSLRYAVDRNRMDHELRQSEERFRQLAENIDDVFWIFDVDTSQVIYVSPAYEQVWGRPRKEIYENPDAWLDAVHGDERQSIQEAFASKAADGLYDVEYRVVRPDGSTRWIHDRGVPVHGQDGHVYRIVGVAEDITPYKRLQRDVAELTSREQQRIGQELHDNIGQQLTGIGLLARSLQKKLEATEAREANAAGELTHNISIAQNQLAKLVRGVMPVEIDANGLMAALSELAKNTKQVSRLDCDFDCKQPVSIEDNMTTTHLYHIAREAVNNAVRHANASQIFIRLAEINRAVIVQVWDDGNGLPNQRLPKTGMGLRIMAHRASVIGAYLDVRGGDEGGTVVTCTLRTDDSYGKSKA